MRAITGAPPRSTTGAWMEYDHEALRRYLDGRLAPGHLAARLAREGQGPEPVFDRASRTLHPENLPATRGLLGLALRASGLYGRGQRNARTIVVREHALALPRLPAAMHGFRLLHISDLHIDVDRDFAATIAERVRGLAWDACVITGDFRYHTSGATAGAIAGFRCVRDALDGPVYAILGNHDSIGMVPEIEALGVRVLLNEGLVLDAGRGAGVWLAGVDDPHFFRQHDIARALEGRPADLPTLLLAHSPEAYREAMEAGVDVMLSGHTHGGQIRLPGGIPLVTNTDCPRDLAGGAWTRGALHGYTTVGVGASVLDVRFNCPAEVVVHRLVPR